MKFWIIAWLALHLSITTSAIGRTILADAKSLPSHMKSKTSPGSARIVGGSNVNPGDYPFMSVLVAVNESFATSLSVNGSSFTSQSFSGSPQGMVSAPVVACGLGGEVCEDAAGRICLIERGDITFAAKALNCQQGGGIGAIIFNNVEGDISGTLGNDFSGSIPVVAINQADGVTIGQLADPVATISVELLPGITQDASCGGSFLGDRWVLTAAHCVDSDNALFLRVNVGEYDLRDGAEEAIAIRNIYIHPNYEKTALDFDVALLELVSSVDAPTIELADKLTTDALAVENAVATSIGWGGRLGYDPGEGPTGDFPDILQEVDIQLLSNTQCRQIFAQSQGISASNTGVSEQMLCAAIDSGGRSACQGDSGGPLLVNTNVGIRQVGITSWGIGCAAPGYPGVYARVSELKDWIDATRFGVALAGNPKFTTSPVGETVTQEYTALNQSEQSVSISAVSSNTENFDIDTSGCTALLPGQDCTVTVSFQSQTAGERQTVIELSSDVSDIPVSGISIQTFAIPSAPQLAAASGPASDQLNWFSGGANAWTTDTTSGLVSGDIGGNQSSILLAKAAAGTLTFDWSVSSEENTDEPDEPFDALFLYVNGEEQSFISGEVAFEEVTIELTQEVNFVEWVYKKDPNVDEGQDQGKVRNVQFAAAVQPGPPTSPPPPPVTSSGGGGSIGWLLLVGLIVAGRKYTVAKLDISAT